MWTRTWMGLALAAVLGVEMGVALLMPDLALAQDAKPGAGGDKAAEQELIKLRRQIADAEMHGDATVLDRLFADEYTHLHSDGRMDSKAEYLKRFTSGSRKYQLYELEDIQVRLYGNTAVIFSRGHTRTTNDGQPRDVRNQFMEVWAKKQGAWRVVAWVTTGTPQTPGAGPAGQK